MDDHPLFYDDANLILRVVVKRGSTVAFSAKFPKNGRFRLLRSATELVNQRCTPTVTPRDVKLRFRRNLSRLSFPFVGNLCQWLSIFITQCRDFCKLSRDTNRVKSVSIHRSIDEGYSLIQISTEKIRIPATKLCCVWKCTNI